ncbi:MAG: hypothetical protein Q9227_006185 [Pyrenula ochraceoflavens]
MSFLGGPECSTAGNPLTQFTKHVQNDNTLQRDRLVGRGPGGFEESMRSRSAPTAPDQMMDDFLQQPAPPAAQPFEMDQMRRALPRFQQRSNSPGWAAEFDPGEQARMEAAFSAPRSGSTKSNIFNTAEFARMQAANQTPDSSTASPISHNSSFTNGFQRPLGMGYMGGMGMPSYHSPLMQQPQQHNQEVADKGKSRMVELDDSNWEAQFAAMETEQQSNLSDEANAAMEPELEHMDRKLGEYDFKFGSLEGEDQLEDFDYDAFLSNNDVDLGFNHFQREAPPSGTYQFESQNPFVQQPDPFAEGISILNSNGNLSLASLAFEAAVQRDPNHAQAWQLLGHSQAQNEKETPAIRALERAVELDSTNLEALMGLAVSYTNEGYDSLAYRTLERWLAAKYPSIISPSELPSTTSEMDFGFTERNLLHDRVTKLYLDAAQLAPKGPNVDPDVQVGLGVLFYGAEEYEKAVDCFNSALTSREEGSTNNERDVHLLWNRLGATLANSGRSEDAIAAYERALQLNPNFVRARYNLGVSCINIGCYPEAAQHLLGALAMHRVVEESGKERAREIVAGGGGMSEEELDRVIHSNESSNIYETLRRALSGMGRRDLAERVGVGMGLDEFRREFEF